jgi:hypothetical protein
MGKRLIFFLFIIASFTAVANTPVPKKAVPKVLQVDSSAINERHLDSRALAAYRSSPDFNYYIKSDKYHPSLWERFWDWVWEMLSRLLQTKQGSSDGFVIKYLLIAGAAIGLIFLLIKLVGADLSNIFKKEPRQAALPYNESLENIYEIDFDNEIETALAQRNYKLAIRLLYLVSLKQLNDAHLIHWQIDKTNQAYLDELSNTEQRQSFTVLTRQFEYVWYGNFPVDSSSFQNIRTLFIDFKKLLP